MKRIKQKLNKYLQSFYYRQIVKVERRFIGVNVQAKNNNERGIKFFLYMIKYNMFAKTKKKSNNNIRI